MISCFKFWTKPAMSCSTEFFTKMVRTGWRERAISFLVPTNFLRLLNATLFCCFCYFVFPERDTESSPAYLFPTGQKGGLYFFPHRRRRRKQIHICAFSTLPSTYPQSHLICWILWEGQTTGTQWRTQQLQIPPLRRPLIYAPLHASHLPTMSTHSCTNGIRCKE